jgi:hypothetical protein
VKRAKGLNQLVATLVYSLPSLGNVGLLLLLLYFMYATAAMNLFGSVAYGEFLDRNTNFSSFGMAMYDSPNPLLSCVSLFWLSCVSLFCLKVCLITRLFGLFAFSGSRCLE